VASEASAGWTVKRRLAGRCHVTAAVAASGGGNCIRRLLQGMAEGAASSRGKTEKAGKAESREQRGGGCLFGERGGCSWAS
jgi:uncharacterized membrane protein